MLGYTHLYVYLSKYLRREGAWDYLATLFIGGPIIMFVILLGENPDVIIWLLASINHWFLIGVILAIFYLPLVIYASIAVRDPTSIVSDAASRILIFLPRPFSDRQGLNYIEIQRLSQIAKIEQGAADWRGVFVNLIIVGTVTSIVSALIFGANEIKSVNFSGVEIQISEQLPNQTRDDWRLILWLFAIATAIFLIWMVTKLYNYYREYITSETSNRIILLACEDAMALLETKNLIGVDELSFSEKRTVAECFGCQLIQREFISPFETRASVPVLDSSGELWLLVSPREHSIYAKLFYLWNRTITNMRFFFSWILRWVTRLWNKLTSYLKNK